MVNLATHGVRHLSCFFYKIEQHLGPGDIVVLPLEYRAYRRFIYNDT